MSHAPQGAVRATDGARSVSDVGNKDYADVREGKRTPERLPDVVASRWRRVLDFRRLVYDRTQEEARYGEEYAVLVVRHSGEEAMRF